MQILKLEDGTGSEYLLIPWRLVKWVAGCLIAALVAYSVYLLYYRVYLPMYAPYYVTERSSRVHNRACAYFGAAKGFYTYKADGWRDCKVCGGRQQIYNHPSDIIKIRKQRQWK